jgi:parallel beta-helix repeat protein
MSNLRALLALLLLAGAVFPMSASAAIAPCTRYASATGNDGDPGSEAAPYKTVGRLIQGIGTGQTGCLVGPATFAGPATFDKNGQTLRSANPANRARILGQVVVPGNVNDATIRALTIDGSDLTAVPVVHVTGRDARILGNEIRSNDELTCLYTDLNSAPYGAGLLVQGNRIHDCQVGIGLQRTPAATVIDNTISGNLKGGIEFFPNADNSTVLRNNIAGNQRGVLFGGDDGFGTSDANLVKRNAIGLSASSVGNADQGNLARLWGSAIGTGNRAEENCLDGAGGNYFTPSGYTVTGTHNVGDAGFGADVTLATGSDCAGYGVLPGATTGAPTGVTQSGATFTGTVDPHFQPASWYFAYGTGAALSSTTARSSAGSGPVPVDVQTTVGLAPATTYRYQLVAVNPSGGTSPGAPVSVTTAAVPTPTPTPTPPPDPDGDGVTGAADACPKTHAGRYDRNHNGCPGPQRLVSARYVAVSSQKGRKLGKVVEYIVLYVDLRVERGARVSVRCRGGGDCRKVKGTVRAKKKGRLRYKKSLPQTIPAKSRLVFRIQKRGRAGRWFELRPRLASVGWRIARQGCIPIGSSRLAKTQACLDQRP